MALLHKTGIWPIVMLKRLSFFSSPLLGCTQMAWQLNNYAGAGSVWNLIQNYTTLLHCLILRKQQGRFVLSREQDDHMKADVFALCERICVCGWGGDESEMMNFCLHLANVHLLLGFLRYCKQLTTYLIAFKGPGQIGYFWVSRFIVSQICFYILVL